MDSDGELITSKVVDGKTVAIGNFVTMTYSGKKNGGMDYPEITPTTDPKKYSVRQDIFVAGHFGKTGTTPNPATSIVVTGALSPVTAGEKGYIWVWAEKPATDTAENKEEDNHYEMLKQFAVFESETVKTNLKNADKLESTMQAFRNAQDDETTGCGADYLTGQEGDDLGDWKCIYWTGGFDFVFKKLKEDGTALNNAVFTLYKANADGTAILTDNNIEGTDKRVAYQVTASGGTKVDKTAKSGGGTTKNPMAGKDAAHPVTIKVKVLDDGDTTVDDGDATVKNVDVYGNGLAVFDKIPPGIYFMVETEFPTLEGKTVEYKAVEEKYRVVVAGDGTFSIHVANRNPTTGAPVWTECEIDSKKVVTWPANTKEAPKETLSLGEGDSAYPVEVYTALNESPLSRKVILKKVDSADYKPLGDASDESKQAKFTVYCADMQTVVRVPKEFDASGNPTSYDLLEDKVSGAGGAFWIGKLPFGTYYLEETDAPIDPTTTPVTTYPKPTKYFQFKVDENGVSKMVGTAWTLTNTLNADGPNIPTP